MRRSLEPFFQVIVMIFSKCTRLKGLATTSNTKRLFLWLFVAFLILFLVEQSLFLSSANFIQEFNDIRVARIAFEPTIAEVQTSSWPSERAQRWANCHSFTKPCGQIVEEYSSSVTPAIPKVIHQMHATNQIPGIYAKYVNSWTRNHKTWEYRFWTDTDIEALIRRDYPQHEELYRSYAHNIQRSDMARLMILHRYGGVYADLDYMSLKPLDRLLENRTCVLTSEPTLQSLHLYEEERLVSNAFIACAPQHPILQMTLDSLDNAKKLTERARGQYLLYFDARYSIYITGPMILSRTYDRYLWQGCCLKLGEFGVTLLPSEVLSPTYDEAQIADFKWKCARLKESRLPHLVLDRLRPACRRFRSDNFRSVVTPRAHARHDWLHLGYRRSGGRELSEQATIQVHSKAGTS